jgi:hypothetical protein
MQTSKRIEPHTLPCCGKEIDAVTRFGEGIRNDPSPGDFTVCVYCGAWLRFTVELRARMFEAEDILDLEAEQISMLRKATRLIRSIKDQPT